MVTFPPMETAFFVCSLELDFHAGVEAGSVVFALHGARTDALVVAQRLVQQIDGFGIDSRFERFAEGAADVQIQAVQLVVVAVVERTCTPSADPGRGEDVTQTRVEACFFKKEGSVRGVFR